MIQLEDKSLNQLHINKLRKWQTAVDNKEGFPAQVAEAKKQFGNKNKKDNSTFDHVKIKLTEICSGAKRCCYCEDSVADEVEHIYPKDIYPDKVFKWENYLYACGPCNGPKNNHFALIIDDKLIDITPPHHTQRDHNWKPTTPPIGINAFIDPRKEDPLEYLWLDLDTFRFTEKFEEDEDKIAYLKANYTIEELQLNKKDYLVSARNTSFFNYKNGLIVYNTEKSNGAGPNRLDEIKTNILSNNHPTVWKEMQLQHLHYPKLKDLFEKCPEALDW